MRALFSSPGCERTTAFTTLPADRDPSFLILLFPYTCFIHFFFSRLPSHPLLTARAAHIASLFAAFVARLATRLRDHCSADWACVRHIAALLRVAVTVHTFLPSLSFLQHRCRRPLTCARTPPRYDDSTVVGSELAPACSAGASGVPVCCGSDIVGVDVQREEGEKRRMRKCRKQ